MRPLILLSALTTLFFSCALHQGSTNQTVGDETTQIQEDQIQNKIDSLQEELTEMGENWKSSKLDSLQPSELVNSMLLNNELEVIEIETQASADEFGDNQTEKEIKNIKTLSFASTEDLDRYRYSKDLIDFLAKNKDLSEDTFNFLLLSEEERDCILETFDSKLNDMEKSIGRGVKWKRRLTIASTGFGIISTYALTQVEEDDEPIVGIVSGALGVATSLANLIINNNPPTKKIEEPLRTILFQYSTAEKSKKVQAAAEFTKAYNEIRLANSGNEDIFVKFGLPNFISELTCEAPAANSNQ